MSRLKRWWCVWFGHKWMPVMGRARFTLFDGPPQEKEGTSRLCRRCRALDGPTVVVTGQHISGTPAVEGYGVSFIGNLFDNREVAE